jgi:protein AIR1/2
MTNSSDEEVDSRTALVGAPRVRANPRSTSRSASNDSNSRPAKRQRRSRNKKDSDLSDLVPRGANFSKHALPVDPDSTSSSGSSSDSSENSDSDAQPDTASANPHEGNTTPAISWNQGRKAAVRTTLGKRSAPSEKTTQFEAVNDKYWRSRSESVSSAIPGAEEPQAKKVKASDQSDEEDELEEGEIDSKSESDDSDSLDSEADDSILLNIGDKMDGVDDGNNYDPATLALQHASSNINVNGSSHGSPSKEEAFRQFSRKYPTAPTALIDLNQHDLEIQANYVHFDKNIHDIDLRLPISCVECQREGHMADICPSKEVCLLLCINKCVSD